MNDQHDGLISTADHERGLTVIKLLVSKLLLRK